MDGICGGERVLKTGSCELQWNVDGSEKMLTKPKKCGSGCGRANDPLLFAG